MKNRTIYLPFIRLGTVADGKTLHFIRKRYLPNSFRVYEGTPERSQRCGSQNVDKIYEVESQNHTCLYRCILILAGQHVRQHIRRISLRLFEYPRLYYMDGEGTGEKKGRGDGFGELVQNRASVL